MNFRMLLLCSSRICEEFFEEILRNLGVCVDK